MNLRRIPARIALGSVAAAVASTALVGASTTAAHADTSATTSYTCSAAGTSSVVPVTVSFGLLPTSGLKAGTPVPAGVLGYAITVTVPDPPASTLTGAGVTGGRSTDFAYSFGTTTKAVAPFTFTSSTTDPTTHAVTFKGGGANSAFVLPAAGTQDVSMPGTFTLIPTTATGDFPITITCTSTAPAKIASVSLAKQDAKVKAKAKVSGTTAKVGVKVSNDYSKKGGPAATGKVLIKDGKKTVGSGKLKNGKVTIPVKLAKGTHSLTVSYKGDTFTNKGTTKKPLKVTIH